MGGGWRTLLPKEFHSYCCYWRRSRRQKYRVETVFSSRALLRRIANPANPDRWEDIAATEWDSHALADRLRSHVRFPGPCGMDAQALARTAYSRGHTTPGFCGIRRAFSD